jgi:hypothetical protein
MNNAAIYIQNVKKKKKRVQGVHEIQTQVWQEQKSGTNMQDGIDICTAETSTCLYLDQWEEFSYLPTLLSIHYNP